MKKQYYILTFLCAFLFILFNSHENINAGIYDKACKDTIIANKGTYKNCGNEYIHTLPEEKEYSSGFRSTEKMSGDDTRILYVGPINGIDTFYSTGFFYYPVVYDNREAFNNDKNYWTTVSRNGQIVYDGSFKDNILLDQSEKSFCRNFNLEGTYLIKQYIGSRVVNTLKVIVVSKEDLSLSVENIKYGDKHISENSLLGKGENLNLTITGGTFGYEKEINVKVNECSFNVPFSKQLIIDNSDFRKCLKYNEKNHLSLTIYNGFNKSRTFKYGFVLNSNNVSIKMKDSISAIETSSRRVLIQSFAGSGKNLNEEFNLYYWSTNPNDKLTYEDFLINYENSDNRGAYSSKKGVILRETEGTYYLYALAKDDDSAIVVRSDEYVLKKKDLLNRIIMHDLIFVLGLCVLAIIPVVVYLFIRGKDTD
jgi:hypothetical protein